MDAPGRDAGATGYTSVQSANNPHERAWQAYLRLLRIEKSPLLEAGATVRQQLRDQVNAIVSSTANHLKIHLPPAHEIAVADPNSLSNRIGRTRATAGVHPTLSLKAASLIFEAVLPVLIEAAENQGHREPPRASGVAVALNREILDRMAAAASGYVDHLLNKVHSSNQLERRTVSRDLHDVAAPAVALALQNLELWELYRATEQERAQAKIDEARRCCIAAIDKIRALSAYLRVDVGDGALIPSLENYLDTLSPSIDRSLRVSGPVDQLPTTYAEELFLIVREAVRNAAQHAAPALIVIELAMTSAAVTGTISDNGQGFDVDHVTLHSHHVGLDSMRERAQLLSADLSIRSRPGHGTTIDIAVPLAATTATPLGSA